MKSMDVQSSNTLARSARLPSRPTPLGKSVRQALQLRIITWHPSAKGRCIWFWSSWIIFLPHYRTCLRPASLSATSHRDWHTKSIVAANILILSNLVSSTAGLGKQLDTAESSDAKILQEEHIKSPEVSNNKYDPTGKLSELCIPPLRRPTRDLPQVSVDVHGLISS